MTAKQRRMEIVVGVTVLMALLITVLVVLWSKGALFSSQRQMVSFMFTNVGGLSVSDRVVVSGVDVGRVTSISLRGDSVMVTTRISHEVTLKKDASVVIASLQLMGGKVIDLSPGTSAEPLPKHQVIRGTYIPGITNLVQILYSRRQEIGQLITHLEETAGQMKSLFNAASSDSNSLGTVVQNLTNLSGRLDSFFQDNAGMMQTTLTNLEQSSTILNNFLSSQDSNARQFLFQGRQLASQLRQLSDSTQLFINKVNSPHSSLGKFLQDDSLYVRLNRSVSNFDSLLLDLQNDPKKYLNGVDLKLKLF